MGSPLGSVAQAPANTAYLAKGAEIFDKPEDGPWRNWVEEMPTDGQFLSIEAMSSQSRVRELVGSRAFASLRAYSKLLRVTTYSTDAIALPRKTVDLDKAGVVTRRLSNYLDGSKGFWGKISVETLLSNPKGIDGVSILNDSHPHSHTGSTWDNKVTDALGPDVLNTGIVAMAGLKLENGEPAGIYPTHLVVGPKLAKMAADLTGALRPVPVAATGLEAYSSAVAVTAMQNYLHGALQVIVEPRFANGTNDDDWFLMDLGKPGIRPIAFGAGEAPHAVAVTDPASENMVHRDEYVYFVQGDAAWGGFIPHCIYGRVA
jgi:hypothetical protein